MGGGPHGTKASLGESSALAAFPYSHPQNGVISRLPLVTDRSVTNWEMACTYQLRLALAFFLHITPWPLTTPISSGSLKYCRRVCWLSVSTMPSSPFFCFSLCLFLLFLGFDNYRAHPVQDLHWHTATATWYGSPEGDGSNGGACGYGSLVDVKPLKARVGAVSPVLFKNGEGCGACYKVKCVDPAICSRRPVTVIITDECPGGYCAFGRTHFDMSGAAFGRMAVNGEGSQLRNRGDISVLYRRTPCKYPGKNVAFHVNEGSTDYWLSLLIEFEDGDGDVGSMHIKQSSSNEWLEMKHLWGANWCIIGGPLKGPFSVKLTTLSTQRTLSTRDVIPKNWSPRATYTSRLNFT